MSLACVDGGLLCGPLFAFVLAGLLAWLRCRKGCEDHSH